MAGAGIQEIPLMMMSVYGMMEQDDTSIRYNDGVDDVCPSWYTWGAVGVVDSGAGLHLCLLLAEKGRDRWQYCQGDTPGIDIHDTRKCEIIHCSTSFLLSIGTSKRNRSR